MRKNNQFYIRKTHRWLGVLIGIQFLGWTISGLYFSWSDIDEIHGDHFLDESASQGYWNTNIGVLPDSLNLYDLGIRVIENQTYLWVNDSVLIDPRTGINKDGVTQAEAESIARNMIRQDIPLLSSELITEVGNHHEYRGRPLPVWAVHFDKERLTAYISQRDGSFQRVRHRSWRWFDFLWMFHTMDYENRDDFNNTLLRIISLMGLFTVTSGFVLFFATSGRRKNKNGVMS